MEENCPGVLLSLKEQIDNGDLTHAEKQRRVSMFENTSRFAN